MSISTGDRLPPANLTRLGTDGPEAVDLASRTKGRKVVIFAVPGAFTSVCHNAHVPSFIRTKEQFAAKGVDEIICITVNDPFVTAAWSDATGASAAGITLLSDVDSSFTKAVGMAFSNAAAGLFERSKRYAMVVEDGTITLLNQEESPGLCDVSAGESLLDAM